MDGRWTIKAFSVVFTFLTLLAFGARPVDAVGKGGQSLVPAWAKPSKATSQKKGLAGWLKPKGRSSQDHRTSRTPLAQDLLEGGFMQSIQDISFRENSVRSLRLKPEIQVSPDQFFTLFGAALGLRLKDGDSLKESRSFGDSLGFNNRRYQQYYKGLEVIAAEYNLLEKEGKVQYAGNNVIIGLDLSTDPILSEAEALSLAEQAIGAPSYPWDVDPTNNPAPEGTLAIASKGFAMTKESSRLVWRFTIATSEPFSSQDVHIDALTGEVVNVADNIRRFIWWQLATTEVPFNQNIVSTGKSKHYGEVNFFADLGQDGKYRLASQKDVHVPAPLGTFDTRKHSRNDPIIELFTDNDNNFLDPLDDVGVSVHWGVQQSMAYFRDKLAWLGWDGKGEKIIRAFILDEVKENAGDAWYYTTGDSMYFEALPDDPDLFILAVVGHEFTHGVIHAITSFVSKEETCALDEGFAELFGREIPLYAYEKLGVDLAEYDEMHIEIPEDPNSHGDPDTYLGDLYQMPDGKDPCHRNATILTRWAWLLENGGSGTNDLGNSFNVAGIDGPVARMLAFLTMMKLSPTADFMEARQKSIDVAGFFQDSALVNDVIEAWHAVGVGDKSKLKTIPANGDKNVDPWPAQLGYEYQPKETITKFQVSSSYSFDSETQVSVPDLSYVQDGKIFEPAKFNLEPGKLYFWRVCYKKGKSSLPTKKDPSLISDGPVLGPDESCKGTWSETHYFWTDDKAVTLVSPIKLPGQLHKPKVNPWGAVFKWQPVAGATGYDLDFGDFKFAVDPGNPANQSGSFIKGEVNLKTGKDYKWGVVAKSTPDAAEGKPYNWADIETARPTTDLLAPANGTSGLYPWGIELKSAKTPGAKGYKFWLSKDPNFSYEIDPTLSYTESNESPNVKININQIDAKGPVYWAVQPKGPPLSDLPDGEWGDRTDPPSFFTVDYTLTKPKLKFPQNQAKIPLNSSVYQQFVWEPVPEATSYDFWLYKNLEYTMEDLQKFTVNAKDVSVVDGGIQSLIKVPSTDSNPDTPNAYEGYCWRVQAIPSEAAAGGPQYSGVLSDAWCYDLGPDMPVLGQTLNTNSPVDYNNTQFVWGSKFAPFGYVIWIWRYDSGLQVDTFSQFVGSSKTFSKQLVPGSEYHWIVSALTEPSNMSLSKLISSYSQIFTTKKGPSPEPESTPPPPPSGPELPKCNAEEVKGSGSFGTDTHEFHLGKTKGAFSISYSSTISPSEFKVFYEGKEIWTSGCPKTPKYLWVWDPKWEGKSGPIPFDGKSDVATVKVIKACGQFVYPKWEYLLNCP